MKIRQVLAMIIAVCFLTMIPEISLAESETGVCGDDLTWTLEDGTLTIIGSGPMYDYEKGQSPWTKSYQQKIKTIILPDELTTIGNYAFYLCQTLTDVSLPDQIVRIGEGAFSNCYRLSSITIPSGVAEISDYTFELCVDLKRVDFPNGLLHIGMDAFNGCKSLNTVDLPDSVIQIDQYAFAYCDLESFAFPEGITELADCIFRGCENLTSVSIPYGTTVIGSGAFAECGIKTINLPDSITEIGGGAFSESDLESIIIPDGVSEIKGNTFYYCTNLKEIVLPSGIIVIPPTTFLNCSALLSIAIPDSVREIGHAAFSRCASMQSLTMPCDVVYRDDTPTTWSMPFEEMPSLNKIRLTKGEGRMQDLERPGYGVAEENNYYYQTPWYQQGDRSISITMDEGISYIGRYSFAYSPEIKEIHFSNDLTEISDFAFYHDTGLTELYFPESLETIGSGAFVECTGLKTVTIPTSLTSIAGQAFYMDDALTDVYYLGTRAEREANLPEENIGGNNDPLLNATWHYAGEPDHAEFDSADVQFRGETPYVVFDGTAQTPGAVLKDPYGEVLDPDSYTVTYRNNTQPGTAYADITWDGSDRTFSVMFKIYLPATEKTEAKNTENGIVLSWDPVPGAKGYVIYRRAWNLTSSGWTTFERWNNTTDTAWTDTKIYAGTRYQYGIKAYFDDPTDNFNLGVVGPLKATSRITTRTLLGVDAGAKQFTARWDGSKTVSGYQIKYSTDPNFKKNVGAIKVTRPDYYRTTVKGLKSGATYYVTVRGYQEFDGMIYFGEWSNVMSCKVN